MICRSWLLTLGLVFCAPVIAVAQAAPGDHREIFEAGNTLYQDGRYQQAIERYQRLVDVGTVDPTLFYNLGNAFYKTNDLGRAILFYQRSLRLAPREKDVVENMALVKSQLQDKQFVTTQGRVAKTIAWFHNNTNTREMVVIASICYVVLCILLVVFIFRETSLVKRIYQRFSVVSPGRLFGLSHAQDMLMGILIAGVLFSTTAMSAYSKTRHESSRLDAVVLAKEASVYGSPTDDATLHFKVHQGTMVEVHETRPGWVRIELPGGLAGWVNAAFVERV